MYTSIDIYYACDAKTIDEDMYDKEKQHHGKYMCIYIYIYMYTYIMYLYIYR